MGAAAMRNVKTIGLPLLARAIFTGALLGARISAGISVFSTIQAALHPEQFGRWLPFTPSCLPCAGSNRVGAGGQIDPRWRAAGPETWLLCLEGSAGMR
jgi:hypothetical protein